MLAPNSRMRSILQRNGLTTSWDVAGQNKLMEAITQHQALVAQRLSFLEGVRGSAKGEPIPAMVAVQDDLASMLVATLMLASQAGLDPALLFIMATTAEAEGKDETTAYEGIARSSLYAAWGSQYAEMLGLPTPRKD